jgi:large subunit ribosomal protein L16
MKIGAQNRKYRKPHAPRRRAKVPSNLTTATVVRNQGGCRSLVALERGWITAGEIEAVRLTLVRWVRQEVSGGSSGLAAARKKASLRWNTRLTQGVTAKGNNLRMGKGKGKVDHWVRAVNPGSVLLSVHKVPSLLGRRGLEKRRKKLGVKSVVVETLGYVSGWIKCA